MGDTEGIDQLVMQIQAPQTNGASAGAFPSSRHPKCQVLQLQTKETGPGLLTVRVQLFGLHSQIIPRVYFSVQCFLVINVPLLVYSEELVFVVADGVSAEK